MRLPAYRTIWQHRGLALHLKGGKGLIDFYYELQLASVTTLILVCVSRKWKSAISSNDVQSSFVSNLGKPALKVSIN